MKRGPLPLTLPGIFGRSVTAVIFRPAASGFFTNTVFTSSSMPSDQAVTSYGGSGGSFGARRTSGYVCFSSMSFA